MASLRVTEEDGRIKVELDSYSTDKRVKDVSWALTPDGLDLQQVAEEFGYIPLKEVRVKTKGIVLNWPLEWKHARVVEFKAPNCPSQIFSPYLTGMTLEVPELPPFFHRCLHLGGVNVVELQNMNSLKNLLEAAFEGLDDRGWLKLSRNWGLFFIFLAVLNEVVWRTMSTDAWVNFKVFGLLPITLVFVIANAPFMSKHMIEDEKAPH